MSPGSSLAGQAGLGPGEPHDCSACGRKKLAKVSVCLFCGKKLPRLEHGQAPVGNPDPQSVHRKEVTDKWVVPFYMHLQGWDGDPDFIARAKAALDEVTTGVVEQLLEIRNWRHQITAGWFCGLKRWHRFTDVLGSALISSRFRGFAGEGYCFALARFETDESAEYLATYLRTALIRPDAYYDQLCALPALMWIDHRRGRLDSEEFLAPGGDWEAFVKTKDMADPALELDRCRDSFWRNMEQTEQAFGDTREVRDG